MKKILIFVGLLERPDGTLSGRKLYDYLSGQLPQAQIYLAQLSDVVIEMGLAGAKAKINDQDITDYDIVWFRSTPAKQANLVKAIAQILNYSKVTYLDYAWGKNKIGNKLSSLVAMNLAGVPVPQTIYFSSLNTKAKDIALRFGFPLVAKDVNLNRGTGIFLINKEEELSKLFETGGNEYLLQKYYPNDGYFRVLILNDKAYCWERWQDHSGGDDLIPISKEEFLPTKNMPDNFIKIALNAAKSLDLQVAGIDILVDKTNNQAFVLEANRAPQFTCDSEVSPEMDGIAKMLEEMIDETKR